MTALVLVAMTAFWFISWWYAPVFRNDLIELTDVRIDGVPITDAPLTFVAGREYGFSCTVTPKKEKFVVVDSGKESYVAPMPFAPQSQHVVPSDRFDPTFQAVFASKWLHGRGYGFVFVPQIKTDATGDSALIRTRLITPSQPGTVELHLLWSHYPEGWVKLTPNMWVPRNNKNPDILWRHTIHIVATKK